MIDKESKIIVTGATGMVGCYIVTELFRQGFNNITAIVRSELSLVKLKRFVARHGFSTQYDSLKISYVHLNDIDDIANVVSGADVVYHTAAVVSLDKKNSQSIINKNVRITHCVVEASILGGVKRFVHISSIATLSAESYPKKTNEESYMRTIEDKNAYSISKFYSENEVWRAYNRGLNVTIVNPAVIIGEGDWRGKGTSSIIPMIDKISLCYTDGVMGYVSAKDTARFCIALAYNDKAIGERFVLCVDNISYHKLISMVAKSLGKCKPRIRISNTLLRLLESTIKKLCSFGLKEVIPADLMRNLRSRQAYNGNKVLSYTNILYSSIENDINDIVRAYKEDKPKL